MTSPKELLNSIYYELATYWPECPRNDDAVIIVGTNDRRSLERYFNSQLVSMVACAARKSSKVTTIMGRELRYTTRIKPGTFIVGREVRYE